MNRRTVLSTVGAGILTGMGSLPSLSKLYTETDTLTVRIFLSETLVKNDPQIKNQLTTNFETYLQNTYGSVLNLSVTTHIDRIISFPSKDTGYRTVEDISQRGTGLYRWYKKHQNLNVRSGDVNVLVAYTHPRRLQGISPTGFSPSCLSSIDNYSLVWAMEPLIDSKNYKEDFYADLFHMISHEIGHSLGLDHSHGMTFHGKRSIMNHPSYSETHSKNIFGDPIVFTDNRGHKLNPKINQEMIILD